MAEFINFYLIPGLILGSIYALGAIGITMTFGILRFANFAHGETMTLGVYIAWTLVQLTGFKSLVLILLVLMPISMMLTIMVVLLIDKAFYKPLRASPVIILVIASFGLMLMIRSVTQFSWGVQLKTILPGIQPRMNLFDFLSFPLKHVFIVGGALLLMYAVHHVLTYTKIGKAMRAMSDSPELARLTGINTEKVVMATWVMGAGLASAAGVFLAVDTQVDTMMGFKILLPMFAAAILGGVGKPYGAMAGGLVIGVAEELSSYHWIGDGPLLNPGYKQGIAFAIMIVILLWRPTGLFKGKEFLMDPVLYGYMLYGISLLTVGGMYAILSLGLNVQWGFTGLFNAGIAGFFGIGAYTAAILTTNPHTSHVGGFQMPYVVSAIAAMLVAGVIAFLVGKVCLKLRSDYLAIATIGIAEIFRLIVNNETWATNGPRGISQIPRPFEGLPEPINQFAFLGVVLVTLAGVYWLMEIARKSPWGRVMTAIRDNETSAKAAGKNVETFRMEGFVIGCMIMALAGALMAHYLKFVNPQTTDPLLATFIVFVMLVIGGSANNKGAILGAFLVWTLWSASEIVAPRLLEAIGMTDAGIRSAYVRIFLIGLLLQIFLQKNPQGLLPETRPSSPGKNES